MPEETLLPSQINTPAMGKRIMKAAATRFPRMKKETFFEHGHWWLRITGNGDEDHRIFDVVDAEGGSPSADSTLRKSETTARSHATE